MSQGGIQGGTLSGPRTAGPAFLFCGKRGRGHRELPAGGAPESPRAQAAGRAGGRRTRGGARGGLALRSRGSEIPSGHRASATARNPPGKPGRGREPGGGGRTPAWRRAGPAPRAGAAVSDRGGSRLPRGPAWRSRCLPASPLRRGAPCPRAQGGRRVGSAATARARGAARVFPAGPARPRRFRGVRSAGRRCESWLAVLNFFVPLRKLQSLSSLTVK